MPYEQFYLFIYRTKDGIRARLMDGARFGEAIQHPGQRCTEIEWDAQRITFNVAYPMEWDEVDAHYLVNTQVKGWPMWMRGLLVTRAGGGDERP